MSLHHVWIGLACRPRGVVSRLDKLVGRGQLFVIHLRVDAEIDTMHDVTPV